MADPRVTQEMKMHALIVHLAVGHNTFEIAAIVNLT